MGNVLTMHPSLSGTLVLPPTTVAGNLKNGLPDWGPRIGDPQSSYRKAILVVGPLNLRLLAPLGRPRFLTMAPVRRCVRMKSARRPVGHSGVRLQA